MINNAGLQNRFFQQNYNNGSVYRQGGGFQASQFQGPPPPPPGMMGMGYGMNIFSKGPSFNGPGMFQNSVGMTGMPGGTNMQDQVNSVFSQFNLNAQEVFSQAKELFGGQRPQSPDDMQNALTQVLQNEGLSSDDIESLESQLPPPPPPPGGNMERMGRRPHFGQAQGQCPQSNGTTSSLSSTSTDSTSDLLTQMTSLLSQLSASSSGSASGTDISSLLSEFSSLMSSYSGTSTTSNSDLSTLTNELSAMFSALSGGSTTTSADSLLSSLLSGYSS